MQNFASLLEDNLKKRKKVQPGSLHRVLVLRDSNDYFFVKAEESGIEGILVKNTFQPEPRFPKEGEVVEAYFLEEHSGEYIFIESLFGDYIRFPHLVLAVDSGIPVWGQVLQKENNGYLVRLGALTGFCPLSQIDPSFKDIDLKGKRLPFDVLEADKKRILLSQRKLVEEARERKIATLKEEWKEGSFVSAKIVSIRRNGLTVEAEGLSGFIPLQEASFKPNPDLEKEFRIGQVVKGRILQLDWEKRQFTLTARDFLEDPWSQSLPFHVGEIREGSIEKIRNVGIFVKLDENFQGLVPVRETGASRKTSWEKEFTVGQKVNVYILEIQPEKRQITLSLKRAKEIEDRKEYQKFLATEEVRAMGSLAAYFRKAEDKKQKREPETNEKA